VLTFLLLVAGTLVSEDLTCIAAGLLVQRGAMSTAMAVGACSAGIFVGDFGLWALGRGAGRAALLWPRIARTLRGAVGDDLRRWLEQHAAGAIVATRFLPGTRLPLYVLSGVMRIPAATFALWSAVAVALWTPTIVLLTASLGDAFIVRFAPVVSLGWLPRACAALAVLGLLRAAPTVAAARVRIRIAARVARWSRWEFWPTWLFYLPPAIWVLLLALRNRGFSTVTAANPGMTDGGTVGESKFEILARLPAEWTIPSSLIPAGSLFDRLEHVRCRLEQSGWCFPLVLKPDVGQRGTGVRLVHTIEQVERYLTASAGPIVMQPYHEGPFEAGVFYYRFPGDARGRILSITDKHFPIVVGDGRSTLEDLVWSHPRYRMQAQTFLRRHRAVLSRILEPGERFRLAIAGNHAQGTLFKDGRHLITPALEQRIDQIARGYDGFFVGRFDIRYRDVEAFKAGSDLSIVELNGATAESTNVYDPDGTLLDAYRQLFRQWSIVFAIGAANRARGARATSHRRLLELVRAHLASSSPFPVSD